MPSQSKLLIALSQIADELKNFEQIAEALSPRPDSIPALRGIDIYGNIMPLNGRVGGDHLIYLDFKKRYDLDARIRRAEEARQTHVVENLESCRNAAGIMVIDVSGHQTTDSMLAAMVHQAFLMGALYELDVYGGITYKLFENLNTRLYKSALINKFVTAIYGEISTDACFQFVSAAHPEPLIFSSESDCFIDINPESLTVFPPLGTIPSEVDIDKATNDAVLGFKGRYEPNELRLLNPGDIMLLYTDGLSDHARNHTPYFPKRLEEVVRESKGASSAGIVDAIKTDLLDFGEPQDDITLVVIKRAPGQS